METQPLKSCTAFKDNTNVASGNLLKVAGTVKEIVDQDEQAILFIFDDSTGDTVDVDFRGTIDDVLKRLKMLMAAMEPPKASEKPDQPVQKGPGRPKLGVVSREVTLLPRHWEWLNSQPGGASVALRKLVEEARRANQDKDKVRIAQEKAYRFLSAMAGNFPGFEEATRALFAGNAGRFDELLKAWPADVRDYARKIAKDAFQPPAAGF
jgi:uncharacterized protein